MQRYGLGVIVWWTLLGIALAAEPQPAASRGIAVSGGQHLFVRYCSACHGMHGRSDGLAASALQPSPPDKAAETLRHKTC
jgi:mono/diheme cytochrome c family protein